MKTLQSTMEKLIDKSGIVNIPQLIMEMLIDKSRIMKTPQSTMELLIDKSIECRRHNQLWCDALKPRGLLIYHQPAEISMDVA